MFRSAFTLLLALGLGPLTARESPAPLPEDLPWDLAALKKETPQHQWLNRDGPVHSLTYAGEKYRGKPTRVFAYFASPATLGKKDGEGMVPGIVLVHGGGGAAFSKWAELWAKRGYAAIAMDLSGCGADRKRLPDGGPGQGHDSKFGTIDEPVENQWSFHAVSNVIRAHSLLRSLEGLDTGRVALTGISWGGYLTCMVAGLDDRFLLAMPVYGCGFLRENSAWKESEFARMTPQQSDKWHRLWDPSRYLGSATMPVVFLNGTNDFAYPMDSYAKTCALVRGEKNFSIQLRMRHGHVFNFPEFFHFVDQYALGTAPMPVVATPVIKSDRVTAKVTTATALKSANLHYTTGPHRENAKREWVTVALEIGADNSVGGPAPPEGVTVWYVDVRDERGALVSSAPIVP